MLHGKTVGLALASAVALAGCSFEPLRFWASEEKPPEKVMGVDQPVPPTRYASIADHPAPTADDMGHTATPLPMAHGEIAHATAEAAPVAHGPRQLVAASHDMTDAHANLAQAPTQATAPHQQPGHGASPHWSYAGADGPEHWAALDPAFASCASGKAQSPIDLGPAMDGLHERLVFNYRPVGLALRNNGHTLQIDYAPGSWIEIEGMRYDLLQLHLHAPSEHAVGGHQAPLEAHLVHQNRHGQLAVVGVMIEPGAANPLLEAMQRMAPDVDQSVVDPSVMVNADTLLPPRPDYFRYVGSLTTPPCSEGVAWHVLKQPITASAANIAALATHMPPHNARPLQALNGRRLTLD